MPHFSANGEAPDDAVNGLISFCGTLYHNVERTAAILVNDLGWLPSGHEDDALRVLDGFRLIYCGWCFSHCWDDRSAHSRWLENAGFSLQRLVMGAGEDIREAMAEMAQGEHHLSNVDFVLRNAGWEPSGDMSGGAFVAALAIDTIVIDVVFKRLIASVRRRLASLPGHARRLLLDPNPPVCGGNASARSFRDAFLGPGFGDAPYQDITGTYTLHATMLTVLRRLESAGVPLAHFVINLGAAEGLCMPGAHWDPANCLLATDQVSPPRPGTAGGGRPFAGLFVDADGAGLAEHLRPFAAQGVEAVSERLFAWNVTTFLESRGVPHSAEIDLLKIDVDGPDYAVLEAVLGAGYRPKLIHIEPDLVLPPFVDHVGADPGGHSGGHGAFIASLGAFARLARQHGYAPLLVDPSHAAFVRADLEAALLPRRRLKRPRSLEELWRLGYVCNPMARYMFCHDFWVASHGVDSRALADPGLPHRARELLAQHFFRARQQTERNPLWGCPRSPYHARQFST